MRGAVFLSELGSFIKRYRIAFGFTGTALTIALIIFQVGQHYGVKSARKQEFKNFIEYIEQIRDGIRIKNVSCQPKTIFLGQTCEISIIILNETPYECDLWIGASAISLSGEELWSTRQDRLITITPDGITTVNRFLTFPTQAKPGVYDLQVNLWYGRKSDPSQSERISSASLRGQIKLKKPKTEPHKHPIPPNKPPNKERS